MIGLSAFSKTTENILRNKECVLNLPTVHQVANVNRLAKTTSSSPVPQGKKQKGYRYQADKFGLAGLTPLKAHKVFAPLVQECPVQLEATYVATHLLAEDDEVQKGRIVTIELRIVCVHIEETILVEGTTNKVDPNKWRPLTMSFQASVETIYRQRYSIHLIIVRLLK